MTEWDFLKKLKEFEGYAPHMYLDSKGHVTIGVGIMLPDAVAAQAGGLMFADRATKKPATADDIKADFAKVKAAPAGMYPPSRYKPHTRLDAAEPGLEAELKKRVAVARADAHAFYPGFAALPASVQYALMDMAFNMGRGNLCSRWALRGALENSDWDEAARLSYRAWVQPDRNQAIREWILHAKLPTNPLPPVPPARPNSPRRFA